VKAGDISIVGLDLRYFGGETSVSQFMKYFSKGKFSGSIL